MTTPQLCTNCGERPASPGTSTVPLCAVCKKLAEGNERGVTMTKKDPKKPNIQA